MKSKNKAMYPGTARVPEIEKVIRGDKELIDKYNAWVAACEKEGVGFFDRSYPDTGYHLYRYTVDTKKFDQLDKQYKDGVAWQLNGAANPSFKEKILTSFHITDKPKKVLDTFYKMRSLVKGSSEKMMYGPGLYASTIPDIWLSRSGHRLDPMKKMTKSQRELVKNKLQYRRSLLFGGYLKTFDDALDQFVETGVFSAGLLLDQPFNVNPEELYSWVGLKPHDPYIITFTIQGRFFDLYQCPEVITWIAEAWKNQHYPDKPSTEYMEKYYMYPERHNIYKAFFHDFGFNGIFIRIAWGNHEPMIVVWDRKSIVDAKLERYSKFRTRMNYHA